MSAMRSCTPDFRGQAPIVGVSGVVRNAEFRPRSVVRGCAPIVGVSVVVRNAESSPAPGCCGCVVGRVVEVEFIGVRGRTRRPVLDFRPTGGIIPVACAGPATYVAPSWRVAPRRVVSPRGFVGVHQWWVQVVVVRNAEYSRVGSGLTYEKAPAAQRSCCAAGACCVKLLGRR